MKILALELSSTLRSVAVVDDGQVRGRAEDGGARGRRALGLVERALREAGLEREEVECIAVGLGPGSYTGIRSAIALAQGWQLAREIPTIGINSVDCLAAAAQKENIWGRVSIVIDAQRNELYLAAYEVEASAWRETERLRLAGVDEVRARVEKGETVVGPEVAKWFPGGRTLFPDAALLGRLSARRNDFVPSEKLEPIYLRETAFVKAPPARVIPAGP